MKRSLSAIAVALAASLSAQASAQTFPDGYTVLSAEDLAPRAGAVSEWEIRQHFPKGSFRTSTPLTPEDLAQRDGTRPAHEILAEFPQPSFQDNPRDSRASHATELAAIDAASAN